MRWIRIRKANIDLSLRATFERYGSATMQVLLGGSSRWFYHEGTQQTVDSYREELLDWLTEEYDRADRHQTWSITMEAAITIFVLGELLIDLLRITGVLRH